MPHSANPQVRAKSWYPARLSDSDPQKHIPLRNAPKRDEGKGPSSLPEESYRGGDAEFWLLMRPNP